MSTTPYTGAAEPAGEWRRTHPLGLVARLLDNLVRGALPVLAAIFATREGWGGLALVAGVLALVLAANAGFVWLCWRKHRYCIGADAIVVEKGVISRQVRSVPFERIQDVAIAEGLIPRLLGLAEVRFETGASGKDEVTLAYVAKGEGERLRDVVRARQTGELAERPSALAPLAAIPALSPERVLFAMDLRRLLTFGIFEFSLVLVAVLFGAAQQFEFLLPFELWEPEAWQALAEGPMAWVARLGIAVQMAAAVLGMATLGLVGLATGIVRTVLRDWGFRLEDTPRGLRRRRGLVTRTDVVMPLHRVQALTISTGIVRRRLGPSGGWHALDLVSLAQDAGASSHTAVPFGTLAEIAPVAELTGFALPTEDINWRRPSARHRFDGTLIQAVPVALIAGIATAALDWVGSGWMALGLALLAAVLAFRQYYLWRHDRHALSERHLFIRRGWLSPRLSIASRVKLQSVEIVQGPLASRRGYADLTFGLAGGRLRVRGIELEDARAIRAAVLGSIAAVDFSRLSGAGPAQVTAPEPSPA